MTSAEEQTNTPDETPDETPAVEQPVVETTPDETETTTVDPVAEDIDTTTDDETPTVEEPVVETMPDETETTPAIAEDVDTATDDETSTVEEPVAETMPDETETTPVVEDASTATDDTDDEADIESATDIDDDDDDDGDDDDSDSPLKRGQLVSGIIKETSPTSISVDLGDEMVGIIRSREIERMNRSTIEELTEGAAIDVYVVNPNDHKGDIILSITRALEELDWQKAEQFSESDDIYEGNIAGYNKGGLIVRFGRLRGFVPQSQISDTRRRQAGGGTPDERFSDMVNDTIYVKVMEVDRNRNRLILSERSASREVREQRKVELINELSVGQVVEGRVVSLEDFGAFVDVGGAEGLVHLTEITWKHITHPRDVLKVGQTVTVEVISIEEKRKRIGLSIKRQEADPWDDVATTYQQGDLVRGIVTKMTKFGAFASLVGAEEIEGLIHISELSDDRVAHPREVVSEGEEHTLRVVKIDVKNRRLGLSIKRVDSAEYLDHDLKTFASETSDDN